jgi:hypothetical protein
MHTDKARKKILDAFTLLCLILVALGRLPSALHGQACCNRWSMYDSLVAHKPKMNKLVGPDAF